MHYKQTWKSLCLTKWNSKFSALPSSVGYGIKWQEKVMEFVPLIIDYFHNPNWAIFWSKLMPPSGSPGYLHPNHFSCSLWLCLKNTRYGKFWYSVYMYLQLVLKSDLPFSLSGILFLSLKMIPSALAHLTRHQFPSRFGTVEFSNLVFCQPLKLLMKCIL